jgi:apolipoprotein N-acyltransferase
MSPVDSPHPIKGPLQSLLVQLALVVTSALLYGAAQPPWNQSWLAGLCLVPLLLACHGASVGRAAWLGAFYGVVVAAIVTPWLPDMLGDYFSVSTLAAWPVALLAWCGLSVPAHAAFAGFCSWLARRVEAGRTSPLSMPLATGGAFMLAELLRSHGPIRGPWALLAYSQPAHSPLAQLSDVIGPYGVGGLLMSLNAGAALWVFDLISGRRGWSSARPLLCVLPLLFMAWGYGEFRLGQAVDGGTKGVRIGLIQSALPRVHRFDATRLEANLALHLRLTEEAVAQGAQLVFWPELALDFQLDAQPELRGRVLETTERLGIELLAGGLGSVGSADHPAYTNSAYLIREGRLLGRTDKVWLMPFSETRPFSKWLGPGDRDAFMAGDRPHLLHTAAGKIGVMICSEAMHPSYVRRVVGIGATLLANPSNDDWFGGSNEAEQPLRQAAFRAVETRRTLVRTSLGGYTTVIDPWGRRVEVAPFAEPAVLSTEVRPGSRLTLYVRFGDGLPALLGVALVASAWFGRPKDAEPC